MDDTWACGSCHSVNRLRDGRCYRCGAPRDTAGEVAGPEERATRLAAERAFRAYVPTWPIAGLASLVILGAAALSLKITLEVIRGFMPVFQALPTMTRAEAQAALEGFLATSTSVTGESLVRAGLTIFGVVLFALWLALVTMDLPALGGGQPRWSTLKAFVYPLIPGWNLWSVPRMIQDVLYRLDPRSRGAIIVFLAWLAFLAGRFLPQLTILAVGVTTPMPDPADYLASVTVFSRLMQIGLVSIIVAEALTTFGAFLLVVTIVRIERRAEARDAEVRMAMATLGTPAQREIEAAKAAHAALQENLAAAARAGLADGPGPASAGYRQVAIHDDWDTSHDEVATEDGAAETAPDAGTAPAPEAEDGQAGLEAPGPA